MDALLLTSTQNIQDDATCCKVGNGNTKADFACFYSADDDNTVPDGVPNDDK